MYDFPGKSGDATLRITAGGTAMSFQRDAGQTGP